MKKLLALSISITTLLIFWACTNLDHSNPFDPEYWKSENVKPSNLYVEQISITQSKISWTDNSSEDNFMIEKTIDGYTNWEIIGNVPGDINDSCTKFFIDSCNSPGFSYRYRIQAQFDDFASEKSEPVVYISDFNAPTKLSSSNLMNSYILLNWADNSKGEQGFVIDRKMSTSGIWEFEYAVIDSNVTTWQDSGVVAGIDYLYRIKAFYHDFYSQYSDEFIQDIPPQGFISIPSGNFEMGSIRYESTQPVHTVSISIGFYMGEYEVTQKEWFDIIGDNPASSVYGLGDDYPIYFVNFYDILVYCNKRSLEENLTPCYSINGSTEPSDWGRTPTESNLMWDKATCNFDAEGYRLPTEAEWEYVSRYNDGRTYAWGEDYPTGDYCNFNATHMTVKVGSYPLGISKLGLYDMIGNVWEWCWDWYDLYSESEQIDPTGPSLPQISRILRGGGFEWGACATCWVRNFLVPYSSRAIIGFRLARSKIQN